MPLCQWTAWALEKLSIFLNLSCCYARGLGVLTSKQIQEIVLAHVVVGNIDLIVLFPGKLDERLLAIVIDDILLRVARLKFEWLLNIHYHFYIFFSDGIHTCGG